MAKISAIIPIGNTHKYLANCLDSVLSQSFQDFEILCVLYNSNIKDIRLLNKYSQYDNRIKVIESVNQNRSRAKNIGIQNVEGKYICFLEPDSYIHENFFIKAFEHFLQFESEFIFTKSLRYNPKDESYYESASEYTTAFEQKYKSSVFNESKCDENAFFNLPCSCWGKFFNKDFLTTNNFIFNEEICYEDNVFSAQTFFKADKISYIDDFLYVSMSTGQREKEDIFDTFKVFQLTREIISKNALYEKYKTKLLLFEMKSLLYHLSKAEDANKRIFFDEIKDNYLHFRIDELNLKELEDSEIFATFIKLLKYSYDEFYSYFQRLCI